MIKRIILFLVSVSLTIILGTEITHANQVSLNAVRGCLSKPAAGISQNYSYSIATSVDNPDYRQGMNVPFKYLLVRISTHPEVAPWYNLIGLKPKSCVNLTPEQTLEPRFERYVPLSIARKLNTVVQDDRNKLYQRYMNSVRSKYPGKTDAEIERVGGFGLD